MKQRLDRILFNNSWGNLFVKTIISHVMLKVSDHRPLHIETFSHLEQKASTFKFQNMWAVHPNFVKEVEKNWYMPARNKGMLKIREKLFRLKQFLIWWNKKFFGNIFKRSSVLKRRCYRLSFWFLIC